ncbi:MAG: acetyl-CoA carboxylase biotin carboxyl carrier protein subunit [Armatimonadota bacterium]|nr:acetyl-CoA carboxylase biotin carboxyl carrier protein subunit [Armatimonadota bacterium]
MDIAKIEELINILKDARVSELTLRGKGSSITVKKAVAPPPTARPVSAKEKPPHPMKHQEAAPDPAPESLAITAPMVGIFHAAPEDRGVRPGASIKPGQIVGAIESMKLMNDVVAEVGGRITEVAVDDGLPVEYGQTLFRLEPLKAESK